jgi:hypothetical protein
MGCLNFSAVTTEVGEAHIITHNEDDVGRHFFRRIRAGTEANSQKKDDNIAVLHDLNFK